MFCVVRVEPDGAEILVGVVAKPEEAKDVERADFERWLRAIVKRGEIPKESTLCMYRLERVA